MMKLKRRFSMEKLVRYNIDYYMRQGFTQKLSFLTGEALLQALKHKLLEESQEVLGAVDKSHLVEELADLQEIILSIMALSEILPHELEEKRIEKRIKTGGFEKGVYIHYVDIPQDSPLLDYFLSQPQKYPEMEAEEVTVP